MKDMSSSLKDISRTRKVGIVAAKNLTSRQRKRLVAEEVKNLCSVMEHPQFKQDPLSTINEHLSNSIKAKKDSELALEEKLSDLMDTF
mmetsp:Transcript_6701/g.10249  ORF Transcript_6701/g.10249 Transcript_6701/m.10249 type:complete len:88 (-) Transcript_6701:308-571(-)